MGPLDKDVVRENALRTQNGGFALEVHQHWYRALPLSSIAVLDLKIDGEPVSPDEMTVQANWTNYTFAELEEQFDRWWFTTDAISVTAPRRGFSAGSQHRVELDLGLLIPYLIIGPPESRHPLLAASHTDKTLTCN
jgi:Domain of unknown function (DUF6379)